MIAAGLNLALFGMGAVFIFLALLILVTKLLSFFLRNSHAPQAAVATPSASASTAAKQCDVADLKLVIAAAIQEFKSKN